MTDTGREQITHFTITTNNYATAYFIYNSIINENLNKFTGEISKDKISFLDTIVYKGE